MRGSEKLVALKPCGKGLLLEVLRYADEVRAGQTFFEEIPETKPKKDLLDLATTLIDQRSAPFEADAFEDHYTEALRKLIDRKAKAKGGKARITDVEEPAGETGGNVIDLMAALKKSVSEEKAEKPARKPATKKRSA